MNAPRSVVMHCPACGKQDELFGPWPWFRSMSPADVVALWFAAHGKDCTPRHDSCTGEGR